ARVPGQHFLQRVEALADPVTNPVHACGLIQAELVFQVAQHAEVVQRMDVAGDRERQRAYPGTVRLVGGQQRRIGMNLFQVFDDRQRLRDGNAVVDEGRHPAERIELPVPEALLLVAHQVHRVQVRLQLLEVQRDAHAVGGRAAEIREKFHHALSMTCSMLPKMDLPLPSSISIFTRSPNFMNGVDGLPLRMISSMRFSARQDAPLDSSWLAMVPEPTMVPAPSGRVLAACATSSAKLNCMSTPASGSPNHSPLIQERSGRWTLKSRQASPSSSGVTNTGESAERGLDCRKPKPLASSPGIRLRSDTSFTRPTSRMPRPASSTLACIGTSPVMTTISASRSMP